MQMTNKLMSFMAAGALFFGAMAPGAMADSTISGNGAYSHNMISGSHSSQRVSVDQSNKTDFHNYVNVRGNTGNNRASYNTGGNSSIDTGSTWASVGVSNMAGKNMADLSGLSWMQPSSNAEISGNGAFSHNHISNNTSSSVRVDQSNNTHITNSVSVGGNTGGNSASYNTGGDSSITTGNAGASVSIDNTAGSNWLSL